MRCWGITDGAAGTTAQINALAAALGVTAEIKNIAVKAPWSWWPNRVYGSPLKRFIVPHFLKNPEALAAPYPDLVISSGRRPAMVAMGLRHLAAQMKFIHIQDPKVSARHFDLVITVYHDAIAGPNVIKTRFALHGITHAGLAEAAAHFAPRFSAYPKPLIAVLLGGSTHRYTLSREAMAQAIMALQRFQNATGSSLLMTPSRRTGEENVAMLKAVFSGNARAYIYDGVEENPYLGMLALAEAVVVTNDSVNMMSDAAATGKPIYMLRLPGHTESKPARFAEKLIADGIARPLRNTLERWDYQAEREMETLAQEIKRRLGL